jgi:PPM family protein phosphatase
MFKLETRGLSDPGCKRTSNEDAFFVDEELGLHLVCDGVSGHSAGDVASKTAIALIHQEIRKGRALVEAFAAHPSPTTRDSVLKLVEQAINRACAEIYRMATRDEKKRGMATTLTLFLKAGGQALTAHVGDSRIYLLRQGKVHLLTEDHSLLAEELRRGTLTPEEAERFRSANVITRAVGFQEFVKPDLLQVELADGDTFLLCSDGLSDYFGADFGPFTKPAPAGVLVRELIQFARSRGGKDNITAVVIRVASDDITEPCLEPGAKAETIGRIPLFRYLSYQEVIKVLNIAVTREYESGSVIIQEGAAGTEMYVLLSGTVRVLKGSQLLSVLRDGSVFGEMGLIENAPRSASIVSDGKTRALVISRKDFYPLLRREAQLAVKLLWSFCYSLNQRLRNTNELLADIKADLEEMRSDLPFEIVKD